MQFRTVVFFNPTAALPTGMDHDQTVVLRSQQFGTEAEADQLLQQLTDLPKETSCITGGHLETHVPGIGWVWGGTNEAESAAIVARRREQPV